MRRSRRSRCSTQAARVAILDVDYHHGNAMQSIFYDHDVLRVDPRRPDEEYPYS
jgi:acetoin utilization deacetylase AcuC-like enzyme